MLLAARRVRVQVVAVPLAFAANAASPTAARAAGRGWFGRGREISIRCGMAGGEFHPLRNREHSRHWRLRLEGKSSPKCATAASRRPNCDASRYRFPSSSRRRSRIPDGAIPNVRWSSCESWIRLDETASAVALKDSCSRCGKARFTFKYGRLIRRDRPRSFVRRSEPRTSASTNGSPRGAWRVQAHSSAYQVRTASSGLNMPGCRSLRRMFKPKDAGRLA
jgi:hypothetical protein